MSVRYLSTELYSFHALVAGFLEVSRDEVNCARELLGYWKNRFSLFHFPPVDIRIFYPTWKQFFPRKIIPSYPFRPIFVHEADLKCFADILTANDSHSYHLASFLIGNSSVPKYYWRGISTYLVGILNYPRSYEYVIHLSIDFLIVSIRSEDLPQVDYIHFGSIITAYFNIFSNEEHLVYLNYENKFELMDDLMKCEQKFDRLLPPLNEHEEPYSREIAVIVLIERSYFHFYVDNQCYKIRNNHPACRDRWKYRLFTLHRDLTTYTNYECSLQVGLLHYALMEDTKAYFHLSNTIKEIPFLDELQTSVAYIAIFQLYVRGNQPTGPWFNFDRIVDIYNQSISVEYSSAAFGYIVIPFLWSMNQTLLAEKLCDKWVKTYCSKVSSDPYILHRYHSQEKIFSHSLCPKPQSCGICCEKVSMPDPGWTKLGSIYYTRKVKVTDSSQLLAFPPIVENLKPSTIYTLHEEDT